MEDAQKHEDHPISMIPYQWLCYAERWVSLARPLKLLNPPILIQYTGQAVEDAQKHVDHLYQGSHINECVMQSVWLALQDPWKQVNPPI